MSKTKKAGLAILIVLLGIQFIRPDKNIAAVNPDNHISAVFKTPKEIAGILERSCNDCHSNNTAYPWYNNIQPVAWWLNHHVKESKGGLNFDEFATYGLRRQYHKLEETEEMVREEKMPLSSYTLIHRDAVLSSAQQNALVEWSRVMRKEMEEKYPIDSLIRKKSKS